MKGKAAYFADVLRGLPTWAEAQQAFLKEFTADPNIIMSELRGLRTVDYDVNKYSEEFQSKVQKLDQSDASLLAQAKLMFVDGLPFKVKEHLVRERDFHQLSL